MQRSRDASSDRARDRSREASHSAGVSRTVAAPQRAGGALERARAPEGGHAPTDSGGMPGGGAAPVLALVLDRKQQARLLDAVRGRAAIRFYADVDALLDAIRHGPASAVITECADGVGRSMLPAIEQIRAGFPSVSVIALVTPGRTPSSEILAVAQAGVHELVMQGFDDEGIALRAALESATRRCAAARVLMALGPTMPSDVLPFLRYSLEFADAEPTVTSAAAYLGVHRKTLVYRLQRAGLPPPSAIIGWCRLFVAAHLLEDVRRSVAQVALAVQFASSAALRGMLRRYTGMRPADLRRAGGLDALLHRFQATVDTRGTASD